MSFSYLATEGIIDRAVTNWFIGATAENNPAKKAFDTYRGDHRNEGLRRVIKDIFAYTVSNSHWGEVYSDTREPTQLAKDLKVIAEKANGYKASYGWKQSNWDEAFRIYPLFERTVPSLPRAAASDSGSRLQIQERLAQCLRNGKTERETSTSSRSTTSLPRSASQDTRPLSQIQERLAQFLRDEKVERSDEPRENSRPTTPPSSRPETPSEPPSPTIPPATRQEENILEQIRGNCVICLDSMAENRLTELYKRSCDHLFHKSCHEDYQAADGRYYTSPCPQCRAVDETWRSDWMAIIPRIEALKKFAKNTRS